MATAYHHLSDYDASTVPSAEGMRFGIVVADWNDRYTYAMADAAIATLQRHGAQKDDIIVKHVPGSFELVYGATWMVEHEEVDAVIAIGCVIRGDTPHFDYICQGTTQGLAELNLRGMCPSSTDSSPATLPNKRKRERVVYSATKAMNVPSQRLR